MVAFTLSDQIGSKPVDQSGHRKHRFRRAVEADIDAILTLMRRYYGEQSYPFDLTRQRAALQQLIGDNTLGALWVAQCEEPIFAYLIVALGFSLEYQGRDAMLDELYVAEDYRGKGLGKAALELAQAYCRRQGIRALHLEVEPQHEQAKKLYQRVGFVPHQRVLMTKRLD